MKVAVSGVLLCVGAVAVFAVIAESLDWPVVVVVATAVAVIVVELLLLMRYSRDGRREL